MDTEARTRKFAHWVFWTGVFNIVAYMPFTCPYILKRFWDIANDLSRALGLGGTLVSAPADVNLMLGVNLLGVVAVMLGIMLVIASLNIELRAWFVFYQGINRIIGALFIGYFVIFQAADQILLFYGAVEVIFAVIYMVYLFSIEGLRITSPLV